VDQRGEQPRIKAFRREGVALGQQADGIMDRTGVVTPAQRQQLAAQAKAAAMGRNNAEGKSQAEMMREAREQEKKDREQWIKDNPYTPSGNASIDRLNKAWYNRR
jgi:hypothetical protein